MENGHRQVQHPQARPTAVPIVEQRTIVQAIVSVEKVQTPAGEQYSVHLDAILSPQAAVRTTVLFDAAGFDRFKDALATAGTGIEIARPGLL